MSDQRLVTMKYLAELAGVNPALVRRCAKLLRSLVGDSDLATREGSEVD